MKKCSRCKETKDFAEFNKNKAQSDGYQKECRPCHKARAQEYAEIARAYVRQNALSGETQGYAGIRLATESMDVIDYLEWLCKWTKHDPETDCQIWNGTRTAREYPIYNAPMPTTPGTTFPVKAHRLSFSLAHGIDALPNFDEDEMTLDHTCGTPSCVNPLHLQVLSNLDNMALRGQERVGKKFSDLTVIAEWDEAGEFHSYA